MWIIIQSEYFFLIRWETLGKVIVIHFVKCLELVEGWYQANRVRLGIFSNR